MKIFKIQTSRIVSSMILQDFWVEAADELEAADKLEDSGFSGFAEGVEEGDDNWLGDAETTSVEIVHVSEEIQ